MAPGTPTDCWELWDQSLCLSPPRDVAVDGGGHWEFVGRGGMGGGRCPESAAPALLQTSTSVGATLGVYAATSVRTRLAPTSAAALWASGSLPTAGRVKVRPCGQGGALRDARSRGEPPLNLQTRGMASSLFPQHGLRDALVGEAHVKGGLSERTAHPVPPGPWSAWWHPPRAKHRGG